MKRNGLKDSLARAKGRLCLPLLLLCAGVYAQDDKIRAVTWENNGFTSEIHVSYADHANREVNGRVYYYWFRGGELKSTLGGYSGNLLHGSFEKFDKAGNLLEKGRFLAGAKEGIWKAWDNQGMLRQEQLWKEGFLKHRLVVTPDTLVTETFRGNVLHCRTVREKDGKLISRQRCRQGEPVTKRKFALPPAFKKVFQKKEDKQAGETTEQDPAAGEPKQ